MAKLFYQGHGSYRIETKNKIVVYIDPFAGYGYDLSADIILVTHEHRDHNKIQLVKQKGNCTILRSSTMLVNGQYKEVKIKNVNIKAVPAYNDHHNINECVGYVIEVDGVKIYASGDTSKTKYMETNLSKENLDYALLPIDGMYNMDYKEAESCAEIIGAQYTIPIHMKPGELFDINIAKKFKHSSRLIVQPGEEIELKK